MQHREADQDHAADVQIQSLAGGARSTPSRAVHVAQDQDQRAQLHRDDSGGQHHVRRAEDLDVEPVGVVPPVVERRRGQHRDAAPGGDERAERPAEAPDPHRSFAQRRSGCRTWWRGSGSRRRCRPARRTDRYPMWAGVQKVSRPMERCQEMSQWMPVMAQVTAATAHQTYQGTKTESASRHRSSQHPDPRP